MNVKIVNKSDNPLPKYATEGSVGMDLQAYLVEAPKMGTLWMYQNLYRVVVLEPGGRVLIPTGLHIEIPKGYEAQIRPRSGMAIKQGVTIVNSPGTIDSDYRGDIGVILHNISDEDLFIKTGDRIAQMVICPVAIVNLVEEEVSETDRGAGGFGHTGK